MPQRKMPRLDPPELSDMPPPASWPESPAARFAEAFTRFGNDWMAWQAEAGRVALAEALMRQAAALTAMNSLAALWQPARHREQAALMMMAATRTGFDLITNTRLALMQMFGESFATVGIGMPRVSGRRRSPLGDRRMGSVVINFPDRRRTAGG